jgi:hypothetical protein
MLIPAMCTSLEAGVEAGIHSMNNMWKSLEQEELWGSFFMGVKNIFQELCSTTVLWTIRHQWLEGARFTFNCCHQSHFLLARGQDELFLVIFSKRGATQGCPLAVMACRVAGVPVSRHLKNRFPVLHQSWHADDALAAGTFKLTKKLCEELV